MGLEGIGSPLLWVGFIGFVLVMLAIDLGIFHRKTHTVSMREALAWSGVWVGFSVLFGIGLWVFSDSRHGVEFFTGYLIEKSLSVDNIFVFVVIFAALRIPPELQHRVLFWGILTALVLRAGMILAGAALFAHFHWLIYVFGAFLILTGVKLVLQRDAEHDPSTSWAMRLIRRIVPSSPHLDGQRFFTVARGRRLATPLFLALLLVELSDVIFALDSIPAIFAVTTDPFIVFTSNIFAILGLRSLFFLLAGMVDRFRYLKLGLAGVLVFVGAKMTLVDYVHLPPVVSLAVISAILATSIIASLRAPYSDAETASRTALATTERGAA